MPALFSNIWVNSTPSAAPAFAIAAAAGETLYMGLVTDTPSGAVSSWPAGFVPIGSQATTADGQALLLARKTTASGTEGTITANLSTGDAIGFVLAVSGVDQTAPEDVAVVIGNNNVAAGSPWPIAATIDPVTNNCLLIAVMGSDVTASGDPVQTFADSLGSSFTVRADLTAGFHNLAVATGTNATGAADTVTGTGTLVGASAGAALILVAARPADGGGGGGSSTNSNQVARGRPMSRGLMRGTR